MKKIIGALASAALVAGGALAAAPSALANEVGTTEGCTPGYWKVAQHWDSWQEAAPSDLFVSTFNMAPVGYVSSSLTMVQALNGKGGAGLDGARQILARAATAAWLNAAYDDGDSLQYPWRRYAEGADGRPALVPTVRAALQGTDREAMLSLARQLDADNNLGCPLS